MILGTKPGTLSLDILESAAQVRVIREKYPKPNSERKLLYKETAH